MIIKSVTVSGVGIYLVGADGIAKIIDASIEYENSIHFVYRAENADGQILFSIENCPVVVSYAEDDDE